MALPVDDILNDACNVMERYIGHEPEVVERLQSILRNARDIKQTIQKVGQSMAPAEAQPTSSASNCGRRWSGSACWWSTPTNRSAARPTPSWIAIGCIVETAHDGSEAQFMVRSLANDQRYDAIIADIRLPDMTGYDLLLEAQGDDGSRADGADDRLRLRPGHSIVRARQAGLQAVLYKPFRLDQLLETVEQIVTGAPAGACGKSVMHCSMIYLLLALAALGHVIFWAAIVNRLHGLGIERRWVDAATAACGVAMAAVPLAIAALFWQHAREGPMLGENIASAAAWAYICFSAIICIFSAIHRLWLTLHPERRSSLKANHTTRVPMGKYDRDQLTAPGIPTWLSRVPGNQVLDLQVHEKRLAIPRMPAGDELRIVHISDLHMSGRIAKDYFQEMVAAVNAIAAGPGGDHRRPGRARQVPRIGCPTRWANCAPPRACIMCWGTTTGVSITSDCSTALADLGLMHLGGSLATGDDPRHTGRARRQRTPLVRPRAESRRCTGPRRSWLAASPSVDPRPRPIRLGCNSMIST